MGDKTITVRFDKEMVTRVNQLVSFYSNPIVSSKNSDVIRYAVEKLHDEVSKDERFRKKNNLPAPTTIKVNCPTCDNVTSYKMIADIGEGDMSVYECTVCEDNWTYGELVKFDSFIQGE
ncbi:hypothetical protein [Halalkalibacter alkaliphilus]|uniref:Uncharacterized protein n=1 Tax=Halalkalibacter alkaliphilus TaxID=2917993 RepID=A0A9X2CWS5_9BACI|nr:hypothetical protein [Halalkalibacter alkaliphilus]MCL7749204.1 hypothetical protein [Halalkalibacter alkaliphilus]